MTLVLGPHFKTQQSRTLAATRIRGSSARSTVQPWAHDAPIWPQGKQWGRGGGLPQHAVPPALCRDVQALLFPTEIRNATGKGKSRQAPELHQRTFFQAQKALLAIPAGPQPPRQHLMLGCWEDLVKNRRSMGRACPEH